MPPREPEKATGSVADQFEPYLPPGDYGNKCDTRYAALTDDSGVGGIPNGTRLPYRIDPVEHAFVYAFRPFDASEDPLQLSKRSLPFSGPPGR